MLNKYIFLFVLLTGVLSITDVAYSTDAEDDFVEVVSRGKKSRGQKRQSYHPTNYNPNAQIEAAQASYEGDEYQTKLTYRDYVNKRDMAIRSTSDYSVDDEWYSFSAFEMFNKEDLARLKLAIRHAPTKDYYPNVCTFELHIHYTTTCPQGFTSKGFRAFPSERSYVSGQLYFTDNVVKNEHNYYTAMDDLLTPEQKEECLAKAGEESIRSVLLGKYIQKQLTKVVGGSWIEGQVDSERFMILDLNAQLVSYLRTISQEENGKIEITGVALAINSYRQTCAFCRNFILGWQWDLENRLRYLVNQEFKNKITIKKKFPTLVFGRYEIENQTVDHHNYSECRAAALSSDVKIPRNLHKFSHVAP